MAESVSHLADNFSPTAKNFGHAVNHDAFMHAHLSLTADAFSRTAE
jgi:hypothetical protein